MFTYLFISFLFVVLILDKIFMPKEAYRSWVTMAIIFSVAGILAIFQDDVGSLARQLGVGRGVDIVIYLALVVLVREFFLARSRHSQMEQQITALARKQAHQQARSFKAFIPTAEERT